MKQQRGGRVNRVNALVKQIVSEELIRNSDSVLNSLTVSHVDTSLDMKKTTVYVTSLDNKAQKILDRLIRNRMKIQKSISSQLDMKYTPRVIFKIDPLIENVEKINQLLNSINDE
jgi:ribosome-binding factor A